jgi:hypothetical protein
VFTPRDGEAGKLPIVWMHGFSVRIRERHTVTIGRR